MENSVIVELFGGLGNQLFQYVAGRILCEYWKVPLYLTKETQNSHNSKNYDYRKELGLKGVLLDFSTNQFVRIPDMRLFYQEDGFMKWRPEDWQSPIVLRGYFQYYPVLKEILPKICEEICEGLSGRVKRMKEKYSITDDSVYIHVRRGDYLKHPDFHYIQGVDYYAQAFRDLIGKRGTYPKQICIVSDDLPWCREQDIFKNMPNRIYVDEDELDTLAIMTVCKGGAILGNSTFSWWGAMLGAEKVGANVYYPMRWIAHSIQALFPESWIQI
jgi:hypothetical protein